MFHSDGARQSDVRPVGGGKVIKKTIQTPQTRALAAQRVSSLRRADLRILNFADATSACRNGKGQPKLAWPLTTLEAFSMLGLARENGLASFWSEKPSSGGYMPWSGIDGKNLYVPPGDRRCVLVSTVDTSIHGHMFAELKPCSARLADGVVCLSAVAFRTRCLRRILRFCLAPRTHARPRCPTLPYVAQLRLPSTTPAPHRPSPRPRPRPRSASLPRSAGTLAPRSNR